jgi:hypothetical protein
MFAADEREWAEETFGACDFGDKRRTKRMIDMGRRLARRPGVSLAKSCEGDAGALEGGYRLLRNEEVKPAAIREGGFASTARQAQAYETLLAVEDTTTVSYQHAAAAQLGVTGSQRKAKRRGYQAHSVLLLDAQSEETVGLLDQKVWRREPDKHGKKHARKQRAYKDKESHKWEEASQRCAERLGPAMARAISVCDREADLYEYLSRKLTRDERFVVRAKVDRQVLESPNRLFETVAQQSDELCCYEAPVAQRGGRKARKAKLSLRRMRVTIRPLVSGGAKRSVLGVNVVLAEEIDAPAGVEPLCWILLTTEAVASAAQALLVIRYYERRWRIEDYHKAYKSGAGVERQRFQSPENLERMMAILAFLAVRMLQLQESEHRPSVRCDAALTDDEWKVLWISTEHCPPPDAAPSARWAYLALAKLGGFADTKRTGHPGWDALWHGWFRLQERVSGYRIVIKR